MKTRMVAFQGMHVLECMCQLRNKATCDYQGSVTIGQTDPGQCDPYVSLCFAGDTTTLSLYKMELALEAFELVGKVHA